MANKDKLITYDDLKPRYNKIGEWKPLIFDGDSTLIGKEVYELTKNESDIRIYGLLFYIKVTTYNVIEFIVKTHFAIPSDFHQMGCQYGKIQLHKVSFDKNYDNIENVQIYDGTMELVGNEIKDIKNGLRFIDIALNRFAFRINTKLEWFIKYPHHDKHPNILINLSDDDMNTLKEYLMCDLSTEDYEIFDNAMSWYVSAINSKDTFVSFLSYCIAIESIIDDFLSGKMMISKKFGIGLPKKSNRTVFLWIKFLCKKKEDSIEKKLRRAMEIVFGDKHDYIKYLFVDKVKYNHKKYSIYSLRSRLAHGSFTVLNPAEREIIEGKISMIKDIAYEFIVRLSSGVLADELTKNIGNNFMLTFTFNNPRKTGVASDLNIFENQDWRIKPEWLF